MSPTARSIGLLEAEGYAVDIVERWIVGANIKRDLFGIFDLLALRDTITLAVQVTDSSHVAAHRTKINSSPLLPRIQAAGWLIELHGWRKTDNRWQCRREVL